MNLAFCFNVKHTTPSRNIAAQQEADFDSPEIIADIKTALESGQHKVTEVEGDRKSYLRFLEIKDKIKIVFNIAEGLHGQAREAQIPSMLEVLKIPFTHSGPWTQTISLDKTLTKIVLLHHGIPTPRFQLIKNSEYQLENSLRFPLIVKPNSEGSSIGIFNENLVYDYLKLAERIRWLLAKFHQPVLVEEYIDGREFTVSILGNKPPRVLPIVEQNFSIFPENMHHFATYEAKWLYEDQLPNPADAYFCPAPITTRLQEKLSELSLKIYQILDCKDVSRIDFRMDKNENIFCLEVNTLPGLMADPNVVSYLPIAARAAGFSFEGLVNTILNEALERYDIYPQKKLYQIVKNYWPQKYLRTT